MAKARALIYLVAFLGATGAFYTACSSYRETKIEIHQRSKIASCLANQIILSPDGKRSVMWHDDTMEPLARANLNVPAGLIVYNREQDEEFKFEVASANKRLTPIRWDVNDQILYFRYGPEGLATWNFLKADITHHARLPREWRQVRIQSVRHGNLDFLKDPAASMQLAKIQDSSKIIRQFATVDETANVFAVGDTDGYPILGATTAPGAFPSAVFVRDPILLRSKEGRESLYYVGHPSDEQQSSSGAAQIPYARPLIDLATGKIVGRYGLTEVVVSSGRRAGWSINPKTVAWLKGSLIQDVSLSQGSVAILFRDASNNLKVAMSSDKEFKVASLCDPSAEVPEIEAIKSSNISSLREESPAATHSEVRFVHFKGRPSFGTLFASGKDPKELVVYFHGGPVSSLWNVGVPKVVKELMTPSRDIIAVEYSGSVGGGMELSLSLPREGPKAIEDDVAAVSDWISHQEYRRISIVAESFGAALGLHAINRFPQIYKSGYFLVPLLHLREPSEWVNNTMMHPVSESGALKFERTAFGGAGGREKFRNWLNVQRELYTPRASDRFYFGTTDRISQPSDLPDNERTRAVTLTLRGGHSVGGRKEVWDSIRAAIGESAAVDKQSRKARNRH